MANSDSKSFNPDEGEELDLGELLPTPDAITPAGERKVAADVLFARLGPELVQRLTNHLPTERMSQDGIHNVMAEASTRYMSLLHERTPGSSTPDTPYVPGTLETVLQQDHISSVEAVDITRRLESELHNYITERQQQAAEDYNTNIRPHAPYQRLRQRDMYLALSTNPWEDARDIAQHLELNPSSAERFKREYVEYVQESNKRHVASAHLTPKIYGLQTGVADPAGRIAGAREEADDLMEHMIITLSQSQSPAFPEGEERYRAIRQFLTQTLHSPAPIVEPWGKVDLAEESDYRFAVSLRNAMATKGEAMKTRLDSHIALLQDLADNMLDTNKISQYTSTLMQKQGRELAATLQEAGIENSREVASRIVNIFTKQVNLVQSNRPDSPGRV